MRTARLVMFNRGQGNKVVVRMIDSLFAVTKLDTGRPGVYVYICHSAVCLGHPEVDLYSSHGTARPPQPSKYACRRAEVTCLAKSQLIMH